MCRYKNFWKRWVVVRGSIFRDASSSYEKLFWTACNFPFFLFFLLSFGSMYKILDYFLSFPKTLDTIHKICNTINFRARLNLFLEGVLQCYFLLSWEGLCDKVAIISAGDCQNLDTSIVTKTEHGTPLTSPMKTNSDENIL